MKLLEFQIVMRIQMIVILLLMKRLQDKLQLKMIYQRELKIGKLILIWEATYNKYVWVILSTMRENKGEFGYRGEGEQIVIDPNDASVT